MKYQIPILIPENTHGLRFGAQEAILKNLLRTPKESRLRQNQESLVHCGALNIVMFQQSRVQSIIKHY